MSSIEDHDRLGRALPETIDGVFRSRAVFLEAGAMDGPGGQSLEDLRWLGRFYRIVVVGEPGRTWVPREGVAFDALPADGVGPLVLGSSLETYASWWIGGSAPQGCRGFFPCRSPVDLARALRAIRRREELSRILLDPAVLSARVAGMRRRRERIVFTNGVFDLLHVGHLRLLEKARGLGDRLIVAINSDDSTRKIKGESRPIVRQFARAEMLTRLRGVDCCCIFTETDPLRLLAVVRPDVLVKGRDYAFSRVVGARFVRGYGGKVARLPLVNGWSTTATIELVKGTARGTESSPEAARPAP